MKAESTVPPGLLNFAFLIPALRFAPCRANYGRRSAALRGTNRELKSWHAIKVRFFVLSVAYAEIGSGAFNRSEADEDDAREDEEDTEPLSALDAFAEENPGEQDGDGAVEG